jgi:hypothetical protein
MNSSLFNEENLKASVDKIYEFFKDNEGKI